MADAEHIKLDDGTVIDVADAVARQKVGSAELQTTAKDCSGAINELKGTLDYCYKSYDTITSIASDTTIISFATGTYKIALSSASTYLPSRYGVLNVYKSNTYSSFCFISTDGKQYERIANNSNNTWYNSWSELALQNTLDIKTSTVTVASEYTAYVNEIKKCANVVSLTLKISEAINPSTKDWITLGTVPQGFRPTSTVEMVLVNNRTDTQYLSAIGRISNTGKVIIWGIPNTLVQPLISVTYIAS